MRVLTTLVLLALAAGPFTGNASALDGEGGQADAVVDVLSTPAPEALQVLSVFEVEQVEPIDDEALPSSKPATEVHAGAAIALRLCICSWSRSPSTGSTVDDNDCDIRSSMDPPRPGTVRLWR